MACWSGRLWSFFTALCPSERYGCYTRRGRRHKALPERARGRLGQVRRWLPDRALIVVADCSYAVFELLAWCTRQARPLTVISRLRLDAALYAAGPRASARPKRPAAAQRRTGAQTHRTAPARPHSLADVPAALVWQGVHRLHLATGTAVWYDGGKPPVAIRSRAGARPQRPLQPPLALLSTDLKLSGASGKFMREVGPGRNRVDGGDDAGGAAPNDTGGDARSNKPWLGQPLGPSRPRSQSGGL
jgi:hypothetical protein